jgi:putative oxygen-independent coproporphyrinogen III oxidase
MQGFGIYIHVPFCRREKCPYCDFYSISSPEPEIRESYLNSLEIELECSVKDFPLDRQVETIFFGGGTPSLLEPEEIWRIYCRIKSLWKISPEVEFSLECNPEDVDLRRAAGYLSAGVNRLSIGCQSFDDRLLKLLGRNHSADICRAAVENALEAGFVHLSSDLIFGGPGSDVRVLLESIETALELGVLHLSLYGYHLEKNSAAYHMSDLAPVQEESYRTQYLAACSNLKEVGWEHYEISNWAASGNLSCRHNLAYWSRSPYLGCGPGAHSFRPPGRRSWNLGNLEEYLKSGGRQVRSAEGMEQLNEEQVLCEEVMLGLRQISGVEIALLEKFRSDRLSRILAELREQGLGAFKDRGRFCLTEQGWLVYDSIVERLVGQSSVGRSKSNYCH